MAPAKPCPLCSLTLGSRSAFRNIVQPDRGVRFFRFQTTKQPSRMILSDRPGRRPTTFDKRWPRKEEPPGPWASLNKKAVQVSGKLASRHGPRDQMNKQAHQGDGYPLLDDGPQTGSIGKQVADVIKRRSSATRRLGSRDGKERTLRKYDKGPPEDDRKALKMQRALTIIPYSKRELIKERLQLFTSFDQFELLPDVKMAVRDEALKGMTDIQPTAVQRLAIPAILGQLHPGAQKRPKAKNTACDKDQAEENYGRKDAESKETFLLAAETGSGKTLAYLLPAINALKVAEARDPDILAYKERQESAKAKPVDEPHPTMARPRVIVLVPTAELAHQVLRVAKSLSHVAKFKAEVLSSDLKASIIQRNLYSPRGVDVIISTPHLLVSIVNTDPYVLARVSHLILDEADSMFDRSFSPVTSAIVARAMPVLDKLIFCSATITKKLNDILATSYPNMVRITTPKLHSIPRRVQLGVIDVTKDPYRNNKDMACADIIYSISKEAHLDGGTKDSDFDVRRILVFVNERAKTEKVADFLKSKGIDAEALHRDLAEKRCGDSLDTFTSSKPIRVPALEQGAGRRRRFDGVKVLVVTDLASRGIDTLAVRHVILYDVPHTTIDFIHRLGRAGRMGRRGRGIALVGKDDRKDVVAEVKRSMFEGQALI